MKKLFLLSALALVALAAAATSATAASLQASPGGAITATSLGKLTFSAGSLSIECNLTMTGNLLRTAISKTAGTKMGEINTVSWANCTGGEVETVLNLPWTLAYSSINGTLPEGVTGINFEIVNSSFELSAFGGFFGCLYRGNSNAEQAVTRISGATYRSGLVRSLQNALRLVSGIGCPSEGRMIGTFTQTAQTITRS
ncbi:MAG TPA: hypothetical protein VFU94_13425 [Conexibacter sp.]|nr:hypothetical protein [Conexibacter sp.]